MSMDDCLLGEDQETERARATCSRPAHREQSGGCPGHLPLPQAAVTRTPSQGPGRHLPGGPAYPKAGVGLSFHGARGAGANHSLGRCGPADCSRKFHFIGTQARAFL